MTEQHSTSEQRYLKQVTQKEAKSLFDGELTERSCEGEAGKGFKLNCASLVGAFEGDKLLGLFMSNMIGKKTCDVHIAFPLKNRKNALSFAKDYVNEVFSKTDINRIETEIPLLYPDVIRFTEKCGFTKEGVKRKNYYKDGKMHNSQIMGILRGDVCQKR